MNHFEDSLKKELDTLPYTKHLDDGGYNDGQIVGFELGARWCMSKILSQKGNFIKETEQRIKDEHIVDSSKFNKIQFDIDCNKGERLLKTDEINKYKEL